MIHANNSEASRPRVLVIMGSVRAARHCEAIAGWVAGLARACSTLTYEMIDLKDWPLPMDDEPGIPAVGQYGRDHTRVWSEKVACAGGFVFVTPQYNWGYPAALKNAIDHLYKEWTGKPAVIVTYGGHGGGKCADQLRQVADGLRMRVMATQPQLTLSRYMIEGGPVAPEADFPEARPAIEAAIAELAAALGA